MAPPNPALTTPLYGAKQRPSLDKIKEDIKDVKARIQLCKDKLGFGEAEVSRLQELLEQQRGLMEWMEAFADDRDAAVIAAEPDDIRGWIAHLEAQLSAHDRTLEVWRGRLGMHEDNLEGLVYQEYLQKVLESNERAMDRLEEKRHEADEHRAKRRRIDGGDDAGAGAGSSAA